MSLEASRMLDGDLTGEELQDVLVTLADDPDQRDRYTVYGLVGDSLRGNSTPDDGFSLRIFERMRSEGVKIESSYDPLGDAEAGRY